MLGRIEENERRIRATSRAAQELEDARAEGLAAEIQQAERMLSQSRAVLELEPQLLREAM